MYRCVLFLLSGLVLGGCQAGYYWHLAAGHSALMGEREPVARVLERNDLPEHERARLELSRELLDFAEAQLELPVGRAYRTHVVLDRDWVVVNLFAAPEFSLEPHRWCYPLVGCLHYRGFFDTQRAQREARRLREQGLEVYRGAAVAYSTLGWFADPLTTPMLRRDSLDLAELLFHELAHRRFWLSGDTTFNESLATAVGREGVRRWLRARGKPERIAELENRARAGRVLAEMVADTRERLAGLYDSDLDRATMRQQRDALRRELRERFASTRENMPALERYESWIQGPLNNAQLNSFSDYHRWVPAFEAMLDACAGQWGCFWDQVEQLAREPEAKRERALESLSDA